MSMIFTVSLVAVFVAAVVTLSVSTSTKLDLAMYFVAYCSAVLALTTAIVGTLSGLL